MSLERNSSGGWPTPPSRISCRCNSDQWHGCNRLELIALDGYPLAKTRMQTTILVPPAGRAEFIVQAPAAGATATFVTGTYSTGPTGNPDLPQNIADIQLTNAPPKVCTHVHRQPGCFARQDSSLPTWLSRTATAAQALFSRRNLAAPTAPSSSTSRWTDKSRKSSKPDEKPVITTKVGAVEDWTIENRALETHAFHIHQIHFQMLEVDGKPVPNQDLLTPSKFLTGKAGPSLSQREGAHGFPRPDDCRHICVSLPHPAARGSRHDAQDPGRAIMSSIRWHLITTERGVEICVNGFCSSWVVRCC